MTSFFDELDKAKERAEATPSVVEENLLKRLHSMKTEGEKYRDKCAPLSDTKQDLKLYRGIVRAPSRNQDGHYFDGNFIQTFFNIQVSDLTDNRPVIRVQSEKSQLKQAAEAMDLTVHAEWDAQHMQRQTYHMAHAAGLMRSAGFYIGYDREKDNITLEQLQLRQMIIDPRVRYAALIDRAEYVFIERVIPIEKLQYEYPGRGGLVKPDAALSLEDEDKMESSKGIISSVADFFKDPTAKQSAEVPAARVWEAHLIDRSMDPKSLDRVRLFPTRRRIVFTQNVILSDGPTPYWHGQIPGEWFDWTFDPTHPYGISFPSLLRKTQLSFNQIIDELIANKVISNFVSVNGAADAMTQDQWDSLARQIGQSSAVMIKTANNNMRVDVQPPPAFGSDDLAIAGNLLNYMQMLANTPPAALGESPGALQSGIALEGLQEGANRMNRSRASRLEDFYTRLGHKLMAMIVQFYPSERVIALSGPTGASIDYVIKRSEMFVKPDGTEMTITDRERALRDFRLSIVPGSSQPGSRVARANQMMRLAQIGAASRRDVLIAAGFPGPVADTMIASANSDPFIQQMMAKANGTQSSNPEA